MTRADAWLLDPFGASLGRWGGAPSGAAVPAWYQPIADLVGDGFITVYTEGVDTSGAGGAQVNSWADVRGGVVWAQTGAGSTRPTLEGDGIVLDGIDDRLEADEYASILDNAYTLLVGFDDPDDVTTTTRCLISTSQPDGSSTARQTVFPYSRPGDPLTTRQQYRIVDTAGVAVSLTSLSALAAGPYDLVARVGAPGASFGVAQIASPGTSIGSATRPSAEASAYTLLTLGSRRTGATPTLAQYWEGRVRYVILADSILSDAEIATIRTALVAQGLVT
jgi:hypothetical protein